MLLLILDGIVKVQVMDGEYVWDSLHSLVYLCLQYIELCDSHVVSMSTMVLVA